MIMHPDQCRANVIKKGQMPGLYYCEWNHDEIAVLTSSLYHWRQHSPDTIQDLGRDGRKGPGALSTPRVPIQLR